MGYLEIKFYAKMFFTYGDNFRKLLEKNGAVFWMIFVML